MSDHKVVNQSQPPIFERFRFRHHPRSRGGGQALVEYALILALVVIALVAVLTITGPAVGNVFSNTVYNLLGGTIQPRDTLGADQFWTQVAAVASYTPDNPGLITNTPAPATKTPTVGPTLTPSATVPTATPSNTPTPGPSPTPHDEDFGYPFEDLGDNPDWWQHDFNDLVDNDWDAEYWNYTSFKSDMSSFIAGTGWQTTYPELDLYWGGGVSPGGGISENFYARYTSTVKLENKEYTWTVSKDDGIRIFVDGVAVVDENVPNVGDAKTWSWSPLGSTTFSRNFTGTAGDHTVKVELYDSGGAGKVQVKLTEGGNSDLLDCNWGLSDEAYHSPTTAWSDSPGVVYTPRSYCTLALRGYIDLGSASNPQLEFYDRYNLAPGTKALVGVSVAGTGQWVDRQIHYYETNMGWTRQVFDLTNFEGTDFTGELIELRFILDATSSSSSYQGWWIDDITVTENIIRRYTVGFSDDMESTSHWYPGGTWARTNESPHSGSNTWSDSPGGSYTNASDNRLELDGLIDLTVPAVVDPQIVFWHRYNLTYYDAIFAEVSTDGGETWQNLTGAYNDNNDALAYRTTNLSWTEKVISLMPYKGQEINFRFRIVTSPNDVADGWYIDDFSIRNKPSSSVYLDWCDDMESTGSQWIAEGSWGIISGPDANGGHTIYAHSGSSYWSDSPQANYLDDTVSSLRLSPLVNLTGATNPELVFWHQWDVTYYDNIYVDVSTDGGESWTDIWHYYYGSTPVGYGGCSGCSIETDGGFSAVMSWTREVVSLRDYIGQSINVRFRLDALSSSYVADGWWIDDVCFQEYNEPVRTIGFSDNFETGANNWYRGGQWAVSSLSEDAHKSTNGITDSPGLNVNYLDDSNAILELKGVVDLTGTVKPTLYFWDHFSLAYRDYTLVEFNVSDDGGLTWQGWREDSSARLVRNVYTATRSWDRQQVDLRPYIPDVAHPNRVIRIRFRLMATYSSNVADGWWIDDVSLVDRNGIEPVFSLPFTESVDFLNNYWVLEGTWDRIPKFRMVGSGNALGPSAWVAEYYDDRARNTDYAHNPTQSQRSPNQLFQSDELVFTRTEAEIDWDWGSGAPNLPIDPATVPPGYTFPYDYFLVRWTRTINIPVDGTEYRIETHSDDGIRVWVDRGTPDEALLIDRWIDRGYNITPDVATTPPLAAGLHTFVVEYYEKGGSARVFVDFGLVGKVFHDSVDDTVPYVHLFNGSVMLEGTVNLAGTTHPAVTYYDIRQLGYSDYIVVEVSTDEGFTWSEVSSRFWGTDSTWRQRLWDLSGYAGQRINIRFRLDARSNTNVGDGWYIDDIVVAD